MGERKNEFVENKKNERISEKKKEKEKRNSEFNHTWRYPSRLLFSQAPSMFC